MEHLLKCMSCADKRKVGMHVAVTFFITALSYNSMTPQDMTTWAGVGNMLLGVVSNPYLLGLCIWNAYSAMCNNEKKKEDEAIE